MDWADDDTMSAEETRARFATLNPEPTAAPTRRPQVTGSSFTTSEDAVAIGREGEHAMFRGNFALHRGIKVA